MPSNTAKLAFLATALLVGAAACKSKPSNADAPASSSSGAASTANLANLSTSLDAVRAAFNAKKREARFLTLLSPT